MGTKPKKVPGDKSFPIQIKDVTDFVDAWSCMDREEKAEYTDDLFDHYFDPEVEIEDLDVWFAKKNAKNLTHPWLGGVDSWELRELAHDEIEPATISPDSLLASLVDNEFFEKTPALTDVAGKLIRFGWLKKPELDPFCEKFGVKKSQKKNLIIRDLLVAGAEPPPAFALTKLPAFDQMIEENIARYVAAVGKNLERFPPAYRYAVASELESNISDWVGGPEQFVEKHIGIDIAESKRSNRQGDGVDSRSVLEISLEDEGAGGVPWRIVLWVAFALAIALMFMS